MCRVTPRDAWAQRSPSRTARYARTLVSSAGLALERNAALRAAQSMLLTPCEKAARSGAPGQTPGSCSPFVTENSAGHAIFLDSSKNQRKIISPSPT